MYMAIFCWKKQIYAVIGSGFNGCLKVGGFDWQLSVFNTVLFGGIDITTYCILKVAHKSLVSSSGEVIDCTQLNTTGGV